MFGIRGFSCGSYVMYDHHHIESLAADADESTVEVVRTYDPGIEAAFGVSRAVMEERLAAGGTCFVLREEGQFLGIMWGHVGSCYVRGVGLPIVRDDSAVYWYWIATVPTARGRGVFTRLSAAFFRYYVGKGVKSCSAIVETRNTIMRNGMKKMGFAAKTKHCFFKLGRVALIVTTDLDTMTHHVSLESGNRGGLAVI